jgi:m7GpppX diphosphatase
MVNVYWVSVCRGQHSLTILYRVEDVLSGVSEADKVLHNHPNLNSGFVLIPDIKWDLTTVSSLYLVAFARSPELRSLRDLRRSHLGLLYAIRDESRKVAKAKWGVEEGGLRMFVHYQPLYCEFTTCYYKLRSLMGRMRLKAKK